ncbi:hypothetical protein GCM10029964_005600 [Kibdelosporangium lantanae]
MRVVLGLVGVAMAVWGALLLLDAPQVLVEAGTWFVAGPIIHDALLAPVVAGLGYVFKGPAKVGAVVSGVLSLIAVPLLWTKYQPENPGLHDRDYPLGLAITLGVVWVVVLIVVGVRKILRSRTEQARG